MCREFGQVGQPSPIESGEVDVHGVADGDGHLMAWLPTAKQAGLGLFDGGDAGGWYCLPVAQVQFVELGGIAMRLKSGDKAGHGKLLRICDGLA
ncbi:hypothetical protein D3C84_1097560 [compost metagenome]